MGDSSLLKILRGLVLLMIILALGTAGYMLIEGWGFLDALYMTVITITTVGYREVNPVTDAGMVFTLLIILMGVGVLAYTLGLVAQTMVDLQVHNILGRRRLETQIKALKNHYIICGYGRIGRIICHELMTAGIPVVIIDQKPELKDVLEHDKIPCIIGDATGEEVLMEAGIERAKGLVPVVLSDADNLFITMTGRALNADLRIVSRADGENTQKKLLRAGANRVVMPYRIGGERMAHAIIRPTVTDFLELTVQNRNIELQMEELVVGERSRLHGVSLKDSGVRQEMNVIILAMRKADGRMLFNPSSGSLIERGDILIALGGMKDLARLKDILSGH